MAERKAREVSTPISPGLESARDEQRAAEDGITRRMSGKASIDPKLVEAREATIAREAELKGRSLRDGIAKG